MPYFSAEHRSSIMVSYRIIDGKYTSPVAYFWMPSKAEIQEKIKEVVEYYRSIIKSIRGF